MLNEKYTKIIFLNAKGFNHRIISNYRRLPQVSEKIMWLTMYRYKKGKKFTCRENNYLFLCKETFSIYEEENEK